MSLIFLVFSVVLLCVLTFLVPCCDAHYDFHIKTMFCSSLLTVVCRRAHVLFTLAVLVCALWYLTHIVLCFLFFFCLSLSCVWRCLVYPMLPVCLSVSCVWRCLVYPMLPVCLSVSCVWRCLVYPMLPVCLSVSCVWRCLVYPMLPVCLSVSCVWRCLVYPVLPVCLSVSCVWRCLVYPMLPVCLSVSCVWRCLVYPMLPVCLSLSCVLCMEVSCIPYVASFTVLTIPDCPFGFSNVYCYVIHNCCFVDRCLSFLYFFFWPFCCLFFFDMQIMITP